MSTRGRLVALAVGLAVLLAAGALVLLGSRTPDCSTAAPRPSLPASLRALGGFDQGYSSADLSALEAAALAAASAEHADLIGTSPLAPVRVNAAGRDLPDALVVPLRAQPSTSPGPPPLAGLVVFLRDCAGTGYLSAVEDDAAVPGGLARFPAVSREQAQARLGSTEVALVYTTSPLQPSWRSAVGPYPSLPAR